MSLAWRRALKSALCFHSWVPESSALLFNVKKKEDESGVGDRRKERERRKERKKKGKGKMGPSYHNIKKSGILRLSADPKHTVILVEHYGHVLFFFLFKIFVYIFNT